MTTGVLFVFFLTLILTPHLSHCQSDDEREPDWEPFIVGGEEAPVGRFPYMCSLRRRGNRAHRCGGTLIRDQWILTAAHCIDPELPNSVGFTPIVYCGSHTSETNDRDLIFTAVEGHLHGSWTGDTDDGYDVGLLKLSRKSNALLPEIDTHRTPLSSGEYLSVLGWGTTDSQQTADTLQIANLQYLPPPGCRQELGDIFQEHMVCAGLGHPDTCRGDSGGPLLISDGPEGNITAGIPQHDLIVGITSFGSRTCGDSAPGVYIGVSYMSDWILEIIDESEDEVQVTQEPPAKSVQPPETPPDEPDSPTNRLSEIAEEPPTTSGPRLQSEPVEPESSTSSSDDEEEEEETESEDEEDVPELDDEEDVPEFSDDEEVTEPDDDEEGPESDDPGLIEDAVYYIRVDGASQLETVLSEGLDPNSRYNDSSFPYGNSDDTLLHWAARFDSPECAMVLIDHDAELEAGNLIRETPLHIGAWQGSSAAVEVLLEQGADVNVRDERFETPLHQASRYGHPEIVQILLNNGADIEALENEGLTPLHFACIYGSVEAAEFLLENGAEVDARSFTETTPLHTAISPGHEDIVKVLLNAGADINAVEDTNETPLHYATFYGQVGIVQILLDEGADIDPVDEYGETPLHNAAMFGYRRIATILVEAGASKTIENDEGETPYDLICTREEAECSESKRTALERILTP